MSNRLLRDNGHAIAEAAHLEPVRDGTSNYAEGTSAQQCWQVLNFHEKRLNRTDATFKLVYVAVEELRKDMTDRGKDAGQYRNLVGQIAAVDDKLNRLYQTVATLSATAANNAKTNAVQLEVTEG